MNLNYLDIIIVVLLFVFGVGGWRKGIILEAATLLGLGLGLYGAFHFSDFTAEELVQYVEINPKYLGVISFIVTFLVVALVVNLLGRLLSKVVKNLNLGFIDRLGGFLVGIAKGVLLCSLLVMLINVFNLRGVVKDDVKKSSVLYPWVEQAVPYVYQGYDLVKEAVQNATLHDPDKKVVPENKEEAVSDTEEKSLETEEEILETEEEVLETEKIIPETNKEDTLSSQADDRSEESDL